MRNLAPSGRDDFGTLRRLARTGMDPPADEGDDRELELSSAAT